MKGEMTVGVYRGLFGDNGRGRLVIMKGVRRDDES
jgi:hypothetical protein